jgi:hypothetical protein
MIKRFIILFTALMAFNSFGQINDAELWTGIGIKADIAKHWGLSYETQTRFYKNASTLRQYYNEISLEYEFLKNTEVQIDYRYSRKEDGGYFTPENRLCLNLSYSKDLGKLPLELSSRIRYQHAFDRLTVINETIYPDIKQSFRLKFDLEYEEFKRIRPSIGYEYFKNIHPAGTGGFLDGYRAYLNVNFDLPDRHEFDVKYIFEREYRTTVQNIHIYLVQYSYTLNDDWFKRKKKD